MRTSQGTRTQALLQRIAMHVASPLQERSFLNLFLSQWTKGSSQPEESRMQIVKGAKGEKGQTGQRGIAGPPGPVGKTGEDGSAGPQGRRGKRGSQGREGAIGPAGRVRNFADMAKQLHYVDRSIDNIYQEMGSHIRRMTELQRELDSLRNKVRQLAAVK